MKYLILFLLFPVIAFPQFTIGLTWDKNIETDLAGYNVYFGPENYENKVTTVDTIVYLDIPNFEPSVFYTFVATAFDTAGNESDYSNKVKLHRCDFNYDGVIDGRDNILINKAFGSRYGEHNFSNKFDLNADSVIDGRDKIIFLKSMGIIYE